jgi:hypothetical protein
VELADANLKFEKDGFEAGKVIQEITLEQGDLLYIPRGLTHDAYTAESHSLHVTTGFLGYTWSQYLIESIVHLSKQDSNFRKFIPLGAIYSSDEQYKESLKLLLAQITKELESKTGLNRFESALKEKQYNCCSNLLMEVMNLNNIDSNTLNMADFVIKENTPVYSLLKIRTNTEHKSHIFLYSVNKFNDNKLYGFNKVTSNGVEQVVLDVTSFNNFVLIQRPFFKNDLSYNSIVFDNYYDEGILNTLTIYLHLLLLLVLLLLLNHL